MVLEVYLDNFVAKPEHSRVVGTHPLLHIDTTWGYSDGFEVLRLRTALNFGLVEVGLEMFEQSNLLGNLFGVVLETVLRSDVLLLSS